MEEVREQTNKASKISGYLRDTIWKNKYIREESKIHIYKTCIRPVFTYADETRAETDIQNKKDDEDSWDENAENHQSHLGIE